MEILKAPLFFMNNIKKKENQESGETHARISQKNFTATDGRTDGELTKNFTFSNFFENRMLAGANSF
jgi:hypothetical protein